MGAEQAQKGLALFEKETVETTIDKEAAAAFKTEHEAAIKAKEDHEKTLTGKDNKKERTAVSKEISAMKADPKYVDACKIAKDLPPPNGNFATTNAPAKAAEEVKEEAKEEKKDDKKKDDKPKKKTESAGISPDERKELEKLKTDIVARKAELKAAGKSGGECNKKDKVNQSAEKLALQTKIEEYRMQLINEFQYSAKDIKADPDMQEMQKQLAKMK